MNLSPLPPGVYTETFTYASGKQVTVYRAPFESDGPRLTGEDGRRVLKYMYAAYVFTWVEGDTKVAIGHGGLDDHMDLWSDIPVTGRWNPDSLVTFAREWTHDELGRWSR